ncbi:UNVERIFIED_CONTAM: Heavy metal-associated isoprenylated plant protein 5 [Sesamum latifolium]|uniref:Heavy metal-associated isoprenylated plant protein 5 n=1 Tax=Sesamum latifolium TaxID=2727402 RepID=A0AAW2TZF9_9LAMI
MGEKDEGGKKAAAEGGEKKAADGGGKKDEGPTTVVLKLDLHCEGCAKKVRRAVGHFEGVEKVKADCAANKLTVTGNADPAWLRERVEYKTKKKVELLSPQPKKDAGAGADKKADEKPSDKKVEEKKAEDKKPEEPVVSTVVMKIRLHCDGCAHKIKRVIFKNIDGVNSVKTDLQKDLVTVTGTMNVKELTAYLKEKLKKDIEIVPPKKDDGGGDKKEKEGTGGDKKEKAGGGDKKEEKKKAAAVTVARKKRSRKPPPAAVEKEARPGKGQKWKLTNWSTMASIHKRTTPCPCTTRVIPTKTTASKCTIIKLILTKFTMVTLTMVILIRATSCTTRRDLLLRHQRI